MNERMKFECHTKLGNRITSYPDSSPEKKRCRDWGSCIFFLYLFFLVCIFWAYDPFLIKCLFTLVFTCWFKSIGAFLDSCFLFLNYIFFSCAVGLLK